ncbi:hypothetical protein [Sinorhizobium meliloti]|uniref:hypothetical protein n=1 Tax=Rhizobium meliloti TaxID=382 RepID=UPI001F1A413C|nr:hypothetical protein [Sinorhizobium meliloti]
MGENGMIRWLKKACLVQVSATGLSRLSAAWCDIGRSAALTQSSFELEVSVLELKAQP